MMHVFWIGGVVMLLFIVLETTVSYWINKEAKKEKRTISKGKELYQAMKAKMGKKHVS
jgi:biopolymer transport protein ExbB/TolQ